MRRGTAYTPGGQVRSIAARAWAVGLAVSALASGCGDGVEAAGVHTLSAARFCAIDGRIDWADGVGAPPEVDDDDPRCARVSLPDRWSERRPARQGLGWYRFELPPASERAPGPWGVRLPRLNMNAAVFADGRWLGSGGHFEEPVTQNWNRPLLFTLDADRVAEARYVDVALFAYRGDWGGLAPIEVGPFEALRAQHERQVALQVVPARAATVVAAVLIALLTALFFATDRKPMYGFFVLGAACFLVHSLAAHVREIYVPYGFGRWLIHTSFDWFVVCFLAAFHRWIGVARPRLERAIAIAFVLSSLASAVAGRELFLRVALVGHGLALLVFGYGFATLLARFSRLPRLERSALLVAGALTVALGAHAFLIQAGVLPRSSPRLLHLLAPLLLLSFGAVMLGDFLRAYREARRLNRELDARVRAREEELKASFEALRELERARLLDAERGRIMREMHDGIGSRLVSALSLTEDDADRRVEVADALRDALLDMRVVIDSLDPSNDDLLTVLGTLRTRLQPALRARGVRVRWEVEDVPDAARLGPAGLLHVLRVVQEAVTNVIKHAEAQELRLRTRATTLPDGRPAIEVEVADDGVGLDEDRAPGRGLRNMRHRAAQLDGTLTIDTDGGTRVTLTVPTPSDP